MTTRIRTAVAGALLLVGLTAGSATAGALVTGAQIKDGSVRSIDVRDGSLTGGDVRDSSLRLRDVGSLPVGPKGETGAPGLPGANGAPGLVQVDVPWPLEPGERLDLVILCGEHETAANGGVSSTRPDQLTIERSTVHGDNWRISVLNGGTSDAAVEGWVMCLTK